MTTEEILSELEAERDRIMGVLAVLEPLTSDGEKKSEFPKRMSRQMRAYWRRKRNA